MESLALKYRMALEGLESIAGYKIPTLHVVGGGCKNTMLCQFTANATGCQVIAGPVEATAIGNLVTQLIAKGSIKDINEGRTLIRNSFPLAEYVCKDKADWDAAYEEFRKFVK
jgi:sugar (pentulose or hexulose) kinase